MRGIVGYLRNLDYVPLLFLPNVMLLWLIVRSVDVQTLFQPIGLFLRSYGPKNVISWMRARVLCNVSRAHKRARIAGVLEVVGG